MATASSACSTCSEWRSASEYTATDRTPMRRSVRMIRQAMAPRLAIRTLLNIPDQNLNRRRVIRITGVVELRAIADERQHVDFGAHFDVLARFGNTIFEGQPAFRRNRDVHEEV